MDCCTAVWRPRPVETGLASGRQHLLEVLPDALVPTAAAAELLDPRR